MMLAIPKIFYHIATVFIPLVISRELLKSSYNLVWGN